MRAHRSTCACGGTRSAAEIVEEGRAWIRRFGNGGRGPGAPPGKPPGAPSSSSPPRTTRAADLRAQLEHQEGKLQAAERRRAQRTEAEERLRLVALGPHARELRATAYHEAGHSLVAHLEGAGIRRVAVKLREALPWEPHVGALLVEGGQFVPYLPAWYSSRAAAAGMEAELLAGFDRDAARAASTRDLRKIPAGRELEIRAEARALLRRHWPAVRAVAEELIRFGELEGEEAERVIRRASPRAA